MKIDLHTHSEFSRHASGTLRECVFSAIAAGIKVLAITDHAPFVCDHANRIRPDELYTYLEEIKNLKREHQDQILILSGLEIDFTPETIEFNRALLHDIDLDFCIGSVHFFKVRGKIVNIWDLEEINTPEVISCYFENIAAMITTGLFDAIGHVANILLGGIKKDIYEEHIRAILPLLVKHKTAFEINTSLLRKEHYDINLGKRTAAGDSLGDYCSIIDLLVQSNVPFSIGSDAHSPDLIGMGIEEAFKLICDKKGTIVYFKKHIPHTISAG